MLGVYDNDHEIKGAGRPLKISWERTEICKNRRKQINNNGIRKNNRNMYNVFSINHF